MADNIDVVPEAVSPSGDVELTIRQAYQTESDLKFTCPASWTIKQVKEHVKECLHNHPDVPTQRLIYSGAPLNNEQILSDILKERNHVAGDQVFFHLMIAQPYRNITPASEVRRRNVNNSGTSEPAPGNTDSNYSAYAQNMAAWQQYWAAYGQLSPDAQMSEHHRLMTHYYTYAMMNPAVPTSQTPANNQEQNVATWRARVQGVAPGAAGAPQVNQGAAAPRNQGRVDLLEVGYRIFKLVMMFSLILLYTSFERFAAVLGAALFIYFIQLRRNHLRNRAQAAAAAAPPANQAPHVNNNNNGENDGDNNTPATEGDNAPVPDVPAPPPVQPTGMQVFIATCYSFVTSFFASLVPDHPIPMDLN
ncbi:CBN-TAG-353 protein [Caenorhabditis brenneri]|uniref:CBN-TAG-353 protein n=1 Tax=Caenorhabditis brenneri TaxID=135651 RepID=G0PNN6_CAEBE|nr:CBN-TAG-353 protein [Caenorhabditis brenneri]